MKKAQTSITYVLVIIILTFISFWIYDIQLTNRNREIATNLCESMGFEFWEINGDKYECIDSSNSIRGFRI